MAYEKTSLKTTEAAALVAATDQNGRIDPVAYEAQRLILENQRMGTIDATALVRNLERSPGFERFDRTEFLAAIDTRLDSPAAKARFAEALDAANITDSGLERFGEQVAGAIGGAFDYVKGKAEWIKEYASDDLSSAYRRVDELQNDPNATDLQRNAAALARDVVGQAQQLYGQGLGGVMHSFNTLKDVVDTGQMAWRFTTDENYRDVLIATAKLYAAETADDPLKPARDLRDATTQALENWERDYAQAKTEGRERQFLGQTEGAVGIELVATLVPVGKLAKFGRIANALDAATPDALDEVAESIGSANRTLRDPDGVARTPHPGESPGELAARSERAEQAADALIDAQVKFFRDEGKLDQLIEAAHRTGNVEGLLRSGELRPTELADVLKRDPAVFDGKVSYLEAVGISTQGVDLARLTARQLGDIGEAIHTYDLVRAGHTDIIAIKNNSGHGIDLVSRNPAGELEFSEIKTSAVGQAKGQRGNPEEFIPERLQRAMDQEGHWAARNTLPALDEVARNLRSEIVDPDTGRVMNLNAKWIQLNVSHIPGSPRLDVQKTVDDWRVPQPNQQSRLDSLSLPDQATHERMRTAGLSSGLDEQLAGNLAALGLLALKQDNLVKKPDDIGVYGERLFASYFPHGRDREPNFHVSVDVGMASEKPAHETLQQVAQLDQQRAQEQSMQPQQTQQQSQPSGPTIGARTA